MNPNVSSLKRTGKNRFSIPPLENGDHLTREEFHRRYEAMPENVKAELIEGVVFMSSPVRAKNHGRPSARIIGWLVNYSAFTPATDVAENVTVFLDLDNEYQPDAVLRIEKESGGNSLINDADYLQGSPELIVEVSGSTISKDLFEKKNAYRRNGVLEYIVWRVADAEIDWFVLENGAYQKLEADKNGIIESRFFAGLRLNVEALLADDMPSVLSDLQKGLQSKKHREFVSRFDKQ